MGIFRHKSGLLGLATVAIFIVLAVAAGLIAPRDPYSQDVTLKFLPPIWSAAGQWPHLLGTDILGRDLLSRLLYGARLSLLIGFISVLVGSCIGIPLGLVSGWFWWQNRILR